jgi:hypothetical protein
VRTRRSCCGSPLLTVEEARHRSDDHEDRADLHESGAGTLHLQQEGVSLLLTRFTRHPSETDDRQDKPDDKKEVEQICHVHTTFRVGVSCCCELELTRYSIHNPKKSITAQAKATPEQ